MVFWDFTAVFSPRAANEFENNFVRALVLSGILSLYWDTELHMYLPILGYWETERYWDTGDTGILCFFYGILGYWGIWRKCG